MKAILSILTLLLGLHAQAGFLVEPFLGYNSGTTTGTTIGGGKASSNSTGFDYGARLGYRFGQAFWFAAEYTGGSGTDKGTTSVDYTKAITGIVFGYHYKRYNFWAGYGISDKVTYKPSTGQIYTSGTNFKVGFGYDVVNHVSLNAEFILPKYTKFGNSTTELNISSVYSKYDSTNVVASVSFPFDFGK